MKLQEVFDKALRSVVAQGEPGHDGAGCAYIGTVNGKEVRCALGHLIDNNEVHKVGHINDVVKFMMPRVEEWKTFERALEFLFELRTAHDNAYVSTQRLEAGDWVVDNEEFVKKFKENMKVFANDNNLVFPENI